MFLRDVESLARVVTEMKEQRRVVNLGLLLADITGLGQVMRLVLTAPNRVELLNLARAAGASREERERVAAALDAEPDLVLVLTGHNEYLRRCSSVVGFDPSRQSAVASHAWIA